MPQPRLTEIRSCVPSSYATMGSSETLCMDLGPPVSGQAFRGFRYALDQARRLRRSRVRLQSRRDPSHPLAEDFVRQELVDRPEQLIRFVPVGIEPHPVAELVTARAVAF